MSLREKFEINEMQRLGEDVYNAWLSKDSLKIKNSYEEYIKVSNRFGWSTVDNANVDLLYPWGFVLSTLPFETLKNEPEFLGNTLSMIEKHLFSINKKDEFPILPLEKVLGSIKGTMINNFEVFPSYFCFQYHFPEQWVSGYQEHYNNITHVKEVPYKNIKKNLNEQLAENALNENLRSGLIFKAWEYYGSTVFSHYKGFDQKQRMDDVYNQSVNKMSVSWAAFDEFVYYQLKSYEFYQQNKIDFKNKKEFPPLLTSYFTQYLLHPNYMLKSVSKHKMATVLPILKLFLNQCSKDNPALLQDFKVINLLEEVVQKGKHNDADKKLAYSFFDGLKLKVSLNLEDKINKRNSNGNSETAQLSEVSVKLPKVL